MDQQKKQSPTPAYKKQTIDELFKHYLKLVKLDARKMPPLQLREIRRAFYGGIGEFMIFQRDEISKLPDNAAVNEMQGFMNDVGEFWLSQNNRQN